MTGPEVIRTTLWAEEAEADNPFAAARCLCRGYDVYGEVLTRGTYIEYLFLLFTGERPTPAQARATEILCIALANPGPREASVHAAMCAGVGGSPAAAALMAAAGVGAGNLGGGREVWHAMGAWARNGTDLAAWQAFLPTPPEQDRADIWPPMEHAPGFDPHGASCATPVRQTLTALATALPGGKVEWLQAQRAPLEAVADAPLAMSGVAAAALADLGLTPEQGEMFYLLARLPGAAVHALEQWHYGWRRFPYFHDGLVLENDPGPVASPPPDGPKP